MDVFDIVVEIACHVDSKTLIAMIVTCRLWNQIAYDSRVWKTLCRGLADFAEEFIQKHYIKNLRRVIRVLLRIPHELKLDTYKQIEWAIRNMRFYYTAERCKLPLSDMESIKPVLYWYEHSFSEKVLTFSHIEWDSTESTISMTFRYANTSDVDDGDICGHDIVSIWMRMRICRHSDCIICRYTAKDLCLLLGKQSSYKLSMVVRLPQPKVVLLGFLTDIFWSGGQIAPHQCVHTNMI